MEYQKEELLEKFLDEIDFQIMLLGKNEITQQEFIDEIINQFSFISKEAKAYNAQPQKVNGYYIESNISNEAKITKLNELADKLDLDKSKFFIYTTLKGVITESEEDDD